MCPGGSSCSERTGDAAVTEIVVELAAFDAGQRQVGMARVTVPGPLAPGASSPFAVPVRVEIPPAAVRVFVSGDVGRVLFAMDGR